MLHAARQAAAFFDFNCASKNGAASIAMDIQDQAFKDKVQGVQVGLLVFYCDITAHRRTSCTQLWIVGSPCCSQNIAAKQIAWLAAAA